GGRLGVGYATIAELRNVTPAPRTALTIAETRARLDAIRTETGKGSSERRRRILAELFGRATRTEQDFLAKLLLGELRQGALEGLMADAIAFAAELDAADVRRAIMLAGDVAIVAEAALAEGRAGLTRFRLELYEPVKPMLASLIEDVDAALASLGEAAFEYKLDGARVQIHKGPNGVRARFRTRCSASAGSATSSRSPIVPLSLFSFDCLHAEGEDLIDAPTEARVARFHALAPADAIVPRVVTASADAGRRFLTEALDAGHAGVMAKALDAPYEAGRRGSAWLKVKVAHTLDLVVLAAEWGSGWRRGW